MPSDRWQLQDIINLAEAEDGTAWIARIDVLPDDVLRLVLATCHSTGPRGARVEARRASLLALLEERRTRRLIENMEALDEKASRLANVGNRLSFIGATATIAGVLVAIAQLACAAR